MAEFALHRMYTSTWAHILILLGKNKDWQEVQKMTAELTAELELLKREKKVIRLFSIFAHELTFCF